MTVSEYTLLPDVPHPRQRFQVTVTLPRLAGDEVSLPAGTQAVAELAAAAVAAEGLLTAWASAQAIVSMIVELPSQADALAAGLAVAKALGCGHGAASVTVEPTR